MRLKYFRHNRRGVELEIMKAVSMGMHDSALVCHVDSLQKGGNRKKERYCNKCNALVN